MADYPDYFELIQIVGADIMVPIDVQGAYIMMPVDIQAQYLTLEIDIVAQTVGNISIDLAAQTVGDIAVNISAQDLAQLTIDIDAQSVGIYLQPEWSALQGQDKNLQAYGTGKVFSEFIVFLYDVPALKTLYLCGATFEIKADVAADADKPQIGSMDLFNTTAVKFPCRLGGNGGAAVVFAKPHVILGGQELAAYAYCWANHACTLALTLWGYEL